VVKSGESDPPPRGSWVAPLATGGA
jgi:hypothetical protein